MRECPSQAAVDHVRFSGNAAPMRWHRSTQEVQGPEYCHGVHRVSILQPGEAGKWAKFCFARETRNLNKHLDV